MSISIFRYNTINSKKANKFNIPPINTIVPMPTESDYKTGYIIRYFMQKTNDAVSPVYEVSRETYSIFITNYFYTCINLDWKIVGTDDEIKEANLKSVKRAGTKLPAIINYLPYLLQFKKS